MVPQPVEKVQINVSTLTYDASVELDQDASEIPPLVNDLPTVFIEKIAAGASESREFPVFFNSPGQHAIHAALAKDAIGVDNDRWNVTTFGASARVLIIDDQDQIHANFLALALNPGGMTGIAPEIRTKDFLRSATPSQLGEFDVIYLLNIDQFDETSVNNLEQFAASGGGVGFFLGDNVDLSFYTSQLYRNGEGLFPMPLEKVVAVDEMVGESVPDIAPEVHPVFPPGMKNPLLDLVQIKKVCQPPIEWSSNRSHDVTVAATVRGDPAKPLIVQSRFGSGNVIVVTTTAGPIWNNWSRNGTFPPVMLLVENLLAAGKYASEINFVGVPINIVVPANLYGPELTLVAPGESRWLDEQVRVPMKLRMTLSPKGDEYQIALGQADATDAHSSVDLPGIYDIWFRTANSKLELKRLALNVETAESEMKLVNSQNCLAALIQSKPSWVDWDAFSPEPKQNSASSISNLFLFVLLGLLIAEQLLAYSASYHAQTGGRKKSIDGRRHQPVGGR